MRLARLLLACATLTALLLYGSLAWGAEHPAPDPRADLAAAADRLLETPGGDAHLEPGPVTEDPGGACTVRVRVRGGGDSPRIPAEQWLGLLLRLALRGGCDHLVLETAR